MRNLDILRVMPVEDLAEFLVRLDIKSTANILDENLCLAGNFVWLEISFGNHRLENILSIEMRQLKIVSSG